MQDDIRRRFPIVATALVAAAMATMVALGIWQLQRAQWKADLLASYAEAMGKPPIPFPRKKSTAVDRLLYRKTSASCHNPSNWNASSGRNAAKQSGIAHSVRCHLYTGASSISRDERESFTAILGWSDDIAHPSWSGGTLTGTLAPDSNDGLRLIADPPVAGLAANEMPSLDDVPNNHMAYAVQWFFFAGVAGIIYAIALNRRRRGE